MGEHSYDNRNDESVSVAEWIATTLIMVIPLVNIVMPFVWAFGSGTKRSKSNFFKAQILMGLIGVVLYFLFAGVLFNSYNRMPGQMWF
ncbi:MAG: hypothetical protein ACQEP4_05280 [Bacillota bacterium]